MTVNTTREADTRRSSCAPQDLRFAIPASLANVPCSASCQLRIGRYTAGLCSAAAHKVSQEDVFRGATLFGSRRMMIRRSASGTEAVSKRATSRTSRRTVSDPQLDERRPCLGQECECEPESFQQKQDPRRRQG
jgi:hypothetical protein